MKITFVTDTYAPQPNGVAMTLQLLVKQLRKSGKQVDVIRPGVLDCEEEGLKVPSVALPVYTDIRVGFPMRKTLQARWLKNRPDIIYVASGWTLGASAITAARNLKIPVVSGFHTNFQQYMSYYNASILERPTLRYLRRAYNRANCTFVSSADVVEQLHSEGFHNLELMPRGVDTQLFSPHKRDPMLRVKWGLRESAGLAGLYVGRMAAEKNLPLTVRTFTEIRHRIPDFQGIFIGEGPKLAKLKRQHPEFIYPGTKFGEELARHYASADLFVFSSETETFGNVTLEAMASGLCVLAYDYAAAQQHINNRVNGYSVPLGNEKVFIESALTAATNPHLSELRLGARNSAEKASSDRAIKKFELKLLKLIERQKPCTFT
ncbi:MAG: glycosyltransferase family 1 protein [Verrucomicrobiota bacterium]